jgi:hypothetical protein
VNSRNGHVFVADLASARINEFTAWGEFARTWGGPGKGEGQFGPDAPEGIAVDSAGSVFAVDLGNVRVQKFDPEGHFVLTFGGKVNKSKEEAVAPESEQNLCPVAPTDICQAGTEGTGSGQFGAWADPGSFIAIDRKATSTASDDVIYVGDQNRIQLFDDEGHYIKDLPDPDGVLSGKVQSLAIDPQSESLYVDLENKENAWRLGLTGNEACELEVARPSAIAADISGNVWVVSAEKFGTPSIDMRVVQFDGGSCKETSSFDATEEGFKNSSGLAANTCVGSESPGNLFISNASSANAFVRAYGTPPVGCEPAPLKAPEIGAQYAASVGTQSALVRAHISPQFMKDTTFYVEYGTGGCASGGCANRVPLSGSLPLGGGITKAFVTTSSVLLKGLSPGTAYHFRFVAESEGGGPEFGVRPKGDEGLEGEATFGAGIDATFRTPRSLRPGSCPNQPLRTGASAFLPDCRAYEMVSPVDKNGGSIETFQTLSSGHMPAAHDQSAAGGDGITYSARQAFGDAIGSPYSSQYLSRRDSGTGWSTHSLNAPHEGFPGSEGTLFDAEYKHFSEDLSQAWLVHAANPPLAPCGPADSSALYRRNNLTDTYEALHCELNRRFVAGGIELLGVSGDGCRAVFRARGKLTAEAEEGGTQSGPAQLYEASCEAPPRPEGPLRLASILPSGLRCKGESTAGTETSIGNEGRANPVWHAFSEDGERLYWSCGESLYLREHADQPQSAMLHGGAGGTGKLTSGSASVSSLVAAKGAGDLSSGSAVIGNLKTTVGSFVVGQPVNPVAGKIPAGTSVVEVGPGTLTLSAPAEATASAVSIVSKGPQPFAIGQTIIGQGIPDGTTISAVGAGTLTLSKNATEKGNVTFEAFSECTEAQKACSRPVAEPFCDLGGCKGPRFQSATPAGAKMLFTNYDPGTGDYLLKSFDATGKGSAAEATSTLAAGLKIGGERVGLLGASEDLSNVYLVAGKVLTETPNSQGDVAVEGRPNLFFYRESSGFSFVGTLSSADLSPSEEIPSPVHPMLFRRASRVSPDGLHAAFMSSAPLTGFDNTDAESGEADAEVFVYDATANEGAGRIVCASCNPTGARPTGRDIVDKQTLWAVATIPGWQSQLDPGRPLSENGRRLFFNSFEPLVNRDTNEREDVYEWEEVDGKGKAGEEECEERGAELFDEEASGCISLISSGQSPTDTEFIDADRDGSNVFIRTGESLVPKDPGLVDVYDARIDGGFAEPEPPKPPCEGEGCQSPPPPPALKTPASLGSYPPNAKAAPKQSCPKGRHRAKKKGKSRCVANHKRHNRRAHAKQGGAAR